MKNNMALAFKPKVGTSGQAVQFANICSHIPATVFENAAGLIQTWRVSYYPDVTPPEYGPVKPLWFLKAKLVFEKSGDAWRIG